MKRLIQHREQDLFLFDKEDCLNTPPIIVSQSSSNTLNAISHPHQSLKNPPLKVLETLPFLGGSTGRKCVIAEDGQQYFLLSNNTPNKTGAALNELLCYELARECGIPTPNYQPIKLNSDICFGSEYANSELHLERVMHTLQEGSRNQNLFVRQMSRLFTFDQMLGNLDRTSSNIRISSTGHTNTLRAIDFSEASVFNSDWQSINRLKATSHTELFFEPIFQKAGFDYRSAENVLERILNLPSDALPNFIEKSPIEWQHLTALIDVWQHWWNRWRAARADSIYKTIRTLK